MKALGTVVVVVVGVACSYVTSFTCACVRALLTHRYVYLCAYPCGAHIRRDARYSIVGNDEEIASSLHTLKSRMFRRFVSVLALPRGKKNVRATFVPRGRPCLVAEVTY